MPIIMNYCFDQATPSMLLLSAASASPNSAVVTGIFAEHFTTTGQVFTNSLGPGLLAGPSQCSKKINGNHPVIEQYGIAGTFGKDNGAYVIVFISLYNITVDFTNIML